jgi:hypothetical protein
MSADAIIEYLHIWEATNNFQFSNQPDKLIWRWTNDGTYSAKSAYEMLHACSEKFKGHHLIWKTWAPLKVKIFLWLAVHRRHWTSDRRRRHGLEARELCYLCDQEVETIDHIIASCPYTREVWNNILQVLHRPFPQPASTTISWWKHVRAGSTVRQRAGMDSLFTLVSWHVWRERNARCFHGSLASVQEQLLLIKDEGDRWI